MHNKSIFKQILLILSIVLFVSCDKDYNQIGSDLIAGNHFDFSKDDMSTVASTWEKTGSIASNNMDVNSLGVLDNAVFGQTTANFVTQAQLESVAPVIDADLKQAIESVTLYIPYYINATVTTNTTTGRPIYTLDSIYGNKASKIKLSIYENKYLLENKNTEPGALSDPNYPQLYYTNQNSFFNSNKGALLYQNNAFVFSADEFKDETTVSGSTTKTYSYTAPGMRVDLSKEFFQKLLFDQTSDGYSLVTNGEFEKYFKGLYFNVEKVDAEGVLNRMNFKKGTIVVKYKERTSLTDATLLDKSITLNLTGNTVNLLSNEASTSVDSYSTPKSDRLYLRGGEGSVVKIDLFNPTVDVVKYNKTTKTTESGSNSIPDELDYIKEKGWLINEASLTFYIDQGIMTGAKEPNRLFLYDMNNQAILSTGVIEKDANGRGLKYRISITDYVRGLVKNDNVNVKLGVSVAQSVSNIKFKKTQNAPAYSIWKDLDPKDKNAYFFPESSVTNPLGTVLYGSSSAVPDAKRLKLEIYYTKPN